MSALRSVRRTARLAIMWFLTLILGLVLVASSGCRGLSAGGERSALAPPEGGPIHSRITTVGIFDDYNEILRGTTITDRLLKVHFFDFEGVVSGIRCVGHRRVTVIPPGIFEVSGIEVEIFFIQIDSVLNLPEGIDYFPNEDTLYADSSYCIQLTGTPTKVGIDTLELYITATVDIFGTPTDAQVTDDTSLVIQIRESLSIEPVQESEFKVYQNVPNPFSEITRLDYFLPHNDEVELNVYNLQGVLVHRESETAPPGKHSFGFDGSGLPPGTYIYRVKNSQNTVSGRLVKSK